jgi:starvation-inducible DNA-binding protein
MAKKKSAEPKSKNKSAAKAEAPEILTSADALRQVVAATYAVMAQTHICHWNVRGPGFFALHTAFEAQYTELFTAVDEIAERIRALGALAPGGLANLAAMAGIKEIKEDASASAMVEHLLDCNTALVKKLCAARDAAGDAGDVQTEDLMIARIQVHEKTIWMLRSYLEA